MWIESKENLSSNLELKVIREIFNNLQKKQPITKYILEVKEIESITGHILLLAIYLNAKNQVAAQKVIEHIYSIPFYQWVDYRSRFSTKNNKIIDDALNYIILYVLGEIESDIWRKAFWAYIKKFSLPNIKLNEVRDFEMLNKDELVLYSSHPMLGKKCVIGWASAFKMLNLEDELKRYLKSFSANEITPSNQQIFLEYWNYLNDTQKIRLKVLLHNIKSEYLMKNYNDLLIKMDDFNDSK